MNLICCSNDFSRLYVLCILPKLKLSKYIAKIFHEFLSFVSDLKFI